MCRRAWTHPTPTLLSAPLALEEAAPERRRVERKSFGAAKIVLKGRLQENNCVAVKQVKVNPERQERNKQLQKGFNCQTAKLW